MPLVNCKIHLELNWNNNCVTYDADTYAGGDNVNNRETAFQITSSKSYVLIVTLSTKDNINLTKQLNESLKDQCIGMNINKKRSKRSRCQQS